MSICTPFPSIGRGGGACILVSGLLCVWSVAAVAQAQDGWVARTGTGPLPQRGLPEKTVHPPEPPAAKSIATRQRRFRIPFSIDRQPQAVREVRLYLSRDLGQNWELRAQRPPNSAAFEFTAPQDGEYWFASRTVDQQNRLWPQTPLQPELKILVDATQPATEFDAYLQRDGSVRMRWRVEDETLRPETLQVQYRIGEQGLWREVERPEHVAWGQAQAEGELIWQPPESLGPVELRLQASDRAGNTASATRRLLMPNVPGAESPAGLADSPRALTDPLAKTLRGVIPRATLPTAQARQAPTRSGAGAAPRDPYAQLLPKSDWINPATRRPEAAAIADRSPPTPTPTPQTAPPTSLGPYDAGSFRTARHQLPAAPADPQQIYPLVAGPVGVASEEPPTAASLPPDGTVRSLPSNPIRQSDSAVRNGAIPEPAWPDGEQPLALNRTSFALEYELDDVPPQEVAQVQLWGTEDAGATWSQWGVDQDRQSPVDVQVREEGLFGFRVVVGNRNGLTSRPPSPGDRADIWIRVDATAPQCILTAAMYGSGVQAGQLDIRWEASDANLLPRPISLYYSSQADGPWQAIEQGLPHTGQYYWRVDPATPSPIYLRIEAKDLAGNRGEHQLGQPISLDGLRPKARIRRLAPQQ